MIAEALAGLFQRTAASYSPWDDYWYRPVEQESTAGVAVTTSTAMQVSAVFACVRVLAETVASLPLHVYRRLPDGSKKRAPDHHLYRVLHDQPNLWQTSLEWREMLMAHLALRGNAYCQRVQGPDGAVGQLIPLHPDRMTVEQLETTRLKYTYRRLAGGTQEFSQDDILHLRGLSFDGVLGVSVISYARNAIGLATAQETHGASGFRNGMVPPYYIKHPGTMKETARKNFRESWKGMHGGAQNANNPPIMEEDMSLLALGVSNRDGQWLGGREFSAGEIARFFRMQPHMIGLLKNATFSNIEHQAIEFVVHTLRPWLVRFEQAFQRDLIADDDDVFVEFLVDGLLRGDVAARYAAYEIGIRSRILNPNEVRSFENLNPYEGGDDYLVAENIYGQSGGQPGGAPKPKPEEDDDAAVSAVTCDGSDDYVDIVEKEESPKGIGHNRAAFGVLIDDAAGRIAAAEIRKLETRVGKAEEDRERFNEWAEEWYCRHCDYVTKTLEPLWIARCREAGDDPEPPVGADGATPTIHHCRELMNWVYVTGRDALEGCESPAALLEDWKTNGTRATAIAAELKRALCPEEEVSHDQRQ